MFCHLNSFCCSLCGQCFAHKQHCHYLSVHLFYLNRFISLFHYCLLFACLTAYIIVNVELMCMCYAACCVVYLYTLPGLSEFESLALNSLTGMFVHLSLSADWRGLR
jgi:hypothetical protein